MRTEYCAGGIVFNDQGAVLLVRNYKPAKNVDYWGFPKGHVDPGESEDDTARREVEEETGITAEIDRKVADVRYVMGKDDDGGDIYKNVAFFRMRVVGGELKYEEAELAAADWFVVEDARDKITYNNDKELLEKAINANR